MAVLKQHPQVDEHTLNLLPIAVILFDMQQFYFLNKKGLQIFEIPSQKAESLDKFSIFQFIDKKGALYLTFRRLNTPIFPNK